jgi:hypothetical protein
LTGGARQARAHQGLNSQNSCDALSKNRQNAQENHCPNFSGRILWESFLLAKLGACRSRRTVTKGDVKNIKTPKIGFLALAAWLVCFHPQLVKAGGEPLPVELSAVENEPPESELGLGKFSPFPFHLSATLRGGFDDNVNTASAGSEQSSWFTNAGAELAYAFGSGRTQLSLSTGGAITYYYERTGQQNYDIDLHAHLKINLAVTPRLLLSLDLHGAYLTEPDFSFGIGFNQRNGNYFYSDNTGTLTYLWAPRFSTATSYTVVAINFANADVAMLEDRIENTFGHEFRFLLWPTTTVVADYRFQLVSFTHKAGDDSTTHFFLGGFDHNFSPRFNISVRGGEEFRFFQGDGETNGPYFEGTLNYAVGKRTVVSWTNSYGIVEPNVTTNPVETAFRSGLQVSQQVAPKITATLGFHYEHDEYEAVTEQFFGFTFTVSPAFAENSFSLDFSLRYAITPHLGIDLGYDRTQISSDNSFREYSRNRFYGGLNFTF